jgi:glycerol-3-phosphate acyltransferase PlsY
VILIVKYLIIAVIAYLLGSIPFGLIISRRLAHVDIREHGSGNIGATNVFRVLGAKYGLLTAVLDVAKSIISVLLAMSIIGNEVVMVAGYDIHIQVAQILAALMVMVGHNWSVYIGFKGGKGVATFFGGLLIINWIVALAALIAAAIVILITRYVSIGSMIASVGALFTFAALAILALTAPVYLIYGLLAAALIIYQHRSNIMRLQAGTESRLGDKKARVK